MPVSSRALVDLVLLGPTNDRRQLQDSPVLGDVWLEYAAKPGEPVDLLITPYKTRPAGPVASLIARKIAKLEIERAEGQESHVAYLQGLVAAKLFFEELLQVIVPMTQWWSAREVQTGLDPYLHDKRLHQKLDVVIKWAKAGTENKQKEAAEKLTGFSALDRYISLAAIILWVATQNKQNETSLSVGDALEQADKPDPIVKCLGDVFTPILDSAKPVSKKAKKGRAAKAEPKPEPQIWQVSLNRRAMPALERSVPSVKGDAARTLFKVKCDKIAWAVIDSGIDSEHPALVDRVVKAYDFTKIREIVSLDNQAEAVGTDPFKTRVAQLRKGRKLSAKEATNILVTLAEDAANDRPVHWELVEKFITIDSPVTPTGGHGTHVAGIIGSAAPPNDSRYFDGMCPDIKLYDFRVLGQTLENTEFAIIAALQYLRYLNERNTYLSVHGANLSLSIPHDVRNFACGRTPICNEAERLVDSGVVVVAAAGNLGYQRFETKDGSYEGYTAFSITDPGNADGVITVGATHRYKPHTYGVSFFSSRGPTGDGRLKPDLVAPGERIESCLPGQDWGELDGTSMAAPHVSGAAAMLMARYDELVGAPRRIKRILCESATDLGRERSFQGYGMLDVLRAFQTI